MRTLTQSEYEFLSRLSKMASIVLFDLGLSEHSLVELLPDGGMGSICFYQNEYPSADRRFGKPIIRGDFKDQDGMLVSFSVNLDQFGRLFELDLWRVDFEPLIRLPSEADPVAITYTDADKMGLK